MSDQSAVVQAIIDILEAAKTDLGIAQVYYGDQGGIPEVPSVTVEMGPKTRTYTQTGLQTTVSFTVVIIVYHGSVLDLQTLDKELDDFAQAVEDELHKAANVDLGGLVINSLVTAVEPGVVTQGTAQFRAHRLTWEALAKERIGV